ncbi:MAG: nucleoside hydrolase [SAR202 cluster bacterium]|nr:nucleoside hydrolase [SAR202 cluster bacterium]
MQRIQIDTDPGTDDALALMMAFNSPEVRVEGITTVGGNASLARTTRNALRLLEYIGVHNVPVARGAARPLNGRFSYGYDVHGGTGLTVRMPVPKSLPMAARAPEFIAHLGYALRGEMVIVALGPLTNVALALKGEPSLVKWVKQIIVMGGAFNCPGNTTPHAEFNVFNDPEATDLVLNSGVPVRMVGIDVCRQVYITGLENVWYFGESRSAHLANKILSGYFATHPSRSRFHLYDPLAMAAAIQPDLFTFKNAIIRVETADSEYRGRTTATLDQESVVHLAVGVDAPRASKLISERLAAGP